LTSLGITPEEARFATTGLFRIPNQVLITIFFTTGFPGAVDYLQFCGIIIIPINGDAFMSDICVGDKVYITVFGDEDLIGEVIAEGNVPWSEDENLLSEEEPDTIYWWKVKIEVSGKVKDFPKDRLRRVCTPKSGDVVRVIRGKNKGKTGEIIDSIPTDEITYWAIDLENEKLAILKENVLEILPSE
jgi:hypothetical protein